MMDTNSLIPKKNGHKLNSKTWDEHTSNEHKWELYDGMPFSASDTEERDRLALCLVYNMGLEHFLKILPIESKQELSSLQTVRFEDISLSIVRDILADILGRYYIDRIILGSPERAEQEILISMFEKWRQLVSRKLLDSGMIAESYTAMKDNEIMNLSLYDLLELRDKYLRVEGNMTE